MLSVLTTKKEDSLNLRITRIFRAKSFSVAAQTDLCSAGRATSSFSPAPLSGVQTIVADSAPAKQYLLSLSSLLLESQLHLGQHVQLNIPSRIPCS